MIELSQLQYAGTIRKLHGKQGELYCTADTNAWAEAEPQWVVLEVEGLLVPFLLVDIRSKGEGVLLALQGVDSEQKASRYLQCKVYILQSDLPTDYATELSVESLVGYEVEDCRKGKLGTITVVDTSTMNVLFELNTGVVFPAHNDFVLEICTDEHRLLVNLPEGILSL